MRQIILIAHNLRSAHNVGSLLRTAEGLGVAKVYLTGYTPYPLQNPDSRLPHLARKIDKQITKTALGAEKTLKWQQADAIEPAIQGLRRAGYTIAALEQTHQSHNLIEYQPPDKIALIVGREVQGIEPEVIQICDLALQIPMFGRKESFNVVQAAAMAVFHLRFA